MGKEENIQENNWVLSPPTLLPLTVLALTPAESGSAALSARLLNCCFIWFVILEVSLGQQRSVWEGIWSPTPNRGHCRAMFFIVTTGEGDAAGTALADGAAERPEGEQGSPHSGVAGDVSGSGVEKCCSG